MPTPTPDWSYTDAFDRNIGLIPEEHQAKLRAARVAIAGLGGVGGIYATTFARLGIGKFSIADPDSFEIANTNRQQGAFVSTYGKSKAETLSRLITDINPEADVRITYEITPENVDTFLEGATLVLDSIDFFAIAPRRLVYREARKRGIPVLGAAPVGFGSSMLNFSPTGMSFDEYFAIHDKQTEREQVVQFALGISPLLLQRSYFTPTHIDFATHRAPSSVLGTLACATMLGSEAYRVIVGDTYTSAPVSWQFDPFVRKFRRCTLWGGNRNPIQLIKRWYLKHILKLAI